MTSRQHARSKRRKAPPAPRTFTAATGLTGVTPEEQAARAAITAAALAAAERAGARAARRTKFVSSVMPTRASPVSASPDRGHRPRTDEPQEVAAPSPGAVHGDSTVAASQDRPGDRPEARPGSAAPSNATVPRRPNLPTLRPARNSSGRAPRVFSRSEQDVTSPPAQTPAGRPPRVFRLPEPEEPSESGTDRASMSAPTIGLADGVSIAEALKAAGRTNGDSESAAAPDPPGGGSSRWMRNRTSSLRDRSGRRPGGGARPDTGSSPSTRSGWAAWPATLAGKKTSAVAKHPANESADYETQQTSGTKKTRAGQAPANKKKAESKRTKRKRTKRNRAKEKAPSTPLERRRRIPVALAAVFAVAVLATSFPLSTILGQHSQQSAASSQLAQVQRQNDALTAQQRALQSNVAINELARGDYQMVTPGQTLYDVLPSSQKAGTTPGAPTSGDPGSQPLVAPNNAPDLSPQQALPTPIPATAAGSSATGSAKGTAAVKRSIVPAAPSTPSSYWGRVVSTFEFWR